MLDENKIPLARLDASRVHEFHYIPKEKNLKDLARRNEWQKLWVEGLSGALSPREDGWNLRASLSGKVVLSCVISGEAVDVPIDLKIERQFLSTSQTQPAELSWDIGENLDIEEMPPSLDLDELISEALLLELPDYPKHERYQTEDHWALDPEMKAQTDENRQKPFANLKALMESRSEEKKTGD